MPTIGGPGQQASPKATNAMPVTRATGIATPASSAPNSNCPTNDGTISNANPVATSATAAKIRTFFIIPTTASICACKPVCLLLLSYRFLLRFEFEGQLINLASELEWNVIAVLQQCDPSARVLADVEVFVLRERDRGGVLQGILRYLLAIHRQHTRATLAQTRTVGLEVEHDGVLARRQLGAFPHRPFEVEQVVEEHNPSTIESKFTLAQKQ